MDLRDYFDLFRKWLWLMVLATAVAATGAWIGTRFMASTYASTTAIMVGRGLDNPDVSAQTIYLSNQLATTYAQMASREPVMRGVVDALKLPIDWQQLKGMVKAQPQPGSPLFEIKVISTNPQLSQALAAETARQLIVQSASERLKDEQGDSTFLQAQIDQLRGNIQGVTDEIDRIQKQIDTETSARQLAELQSRLSARQSQLGEWQSRYAEMRTALQGSEVNALSIIEPATPGWRVGPNVGMNVLLAALIGFGLALGAALVIEYMDDTVKSPEVVERRLHLPALIAIDRMDNVGERAEGLVTVTQPRSPVAEAYRGLRTNLEFALLGRPPGAVTITSANPGEGKSTTAANLAVVLAQTGRRVVLMDGDLRKPSIHRFFDLTNNIGFTSLLLDRDLALDSALREVEGVPNLRVLTSGPLPPNPAEVLGSARTWEIIDSLNADADILVIDCPPILAVTDAAILSARASGTLMIFDAALTRLDAAHKALEVLEKAGIKPLGAVVNKLDREHAGGYYRYTYYTQRGYGYADPEATDLSGGRPKGGGRPPTTGRPAGALDAPSRGGWRQRLAETISSLLS